VDDFRIYNYALSQDEIAGTMRGDVTLAWAPSPADRSTPDIDTVIPLTWSPGENASQHDVYFGTDENAVDSADASDTTGIYKGRQSSTSYTPAEGVEWGGGPYYWRIDEINTDGTVNRGRIWRFTVADYLTVDDFESYNDLDPTDPRSNRIFNVWVDGFEDPTNGSLVGYANPPFAEKTAVHSGNQSMPFEYDNSAGTSEAVKTLTSRKDWTQEGVAVLTIWFIGNVSNAPDPMYVVVNGTAAVTHEDSNVARINQWTPWNIDLQTFADQGVNLSNINTITIGFGNRNNPTTGGSGMMFFDDIRLHRPQ
jgi:hypothetical protein